MQYTENYGYKKPEYGEKSRVDDLNYNATLSDNLMKNTRDMLAEYFSQTKPYTAGKVVQLEGKMYRFKVDHAAGNFNPAEVDEEPLGNMLGSSMPPITAEAEGNPIEITDAASAPMVKCISEIQGSQDLHGYDKPWVGGAGKNEIDVDGQVFSYSSNDPISIATFNAVEGTTYTISCYQDKALASSTRNAIQYQLAGESVYENTNSNYHPEAGRHSLTITAATSGTAYVFFWCHTPSDTTITYSKFMVEIGSTATSYAPYSNICPITAYTEGEIEVRKHNIYDGETEAGYIYNGTFYPSTSYKVTKNFIPVNPNTSYKAVGVSGDGQITCYSESKTYLSSIAGMGGETRIFTTPSDCYFIKFYNPNAYMEGNVGINYPSTFTEYEPYTSTTHTTTYPSAIYRGSEDVVNGEVSADNDGEMWVAVDISTLDFTQASEGNRHIFRSDSLVGSIKPSSSASAMPYAIASCYEGMGFSPLSENDNGYFAVAQATHGNAGRVVFIDHRFSTVADFVAGIAGQTIAYRLNTPTTTPVTPTNLPIKSLLGYTHIESSTGDMEIEYYTEDWQKIIDLIEKESGGESEENHEYSTTAKKVGTWIDGRDIYEIVYTGTFSISSTGTTIGETLPNGCTVLSAQAVNKTGHGDGGCVQCAPLVVMENNTNSTFTVYSSWSWNVDAKAIIIQYIEASS